MPLVLQVITAGRGFEEQLGFAQIFCNRLQKIWESRKKRLR
jgi:hypothetical protein